MKTLIIIEVIIIFIAVVFIILAFKIGMASAKASRIGYYALAPINKVELSLAEKMAYKYFIFIGRFRKILKKSKYFTNKAKKYVKYIKYEDKNKIYAIDFITNKLIIASMLLILTVISQIFTGKNFSFFEYLLDFLIGYFSLDICLFIYYKRKTKNMDNDLLRAVIIMNNAFKAGKSTLQAIEIASNELTYPLSDEFKKMYLDMKYGLSVDTVFERFAKRVNVDAAMYLSSSLTILNKTGGNIVEVFSSIERTLFDKKKLNEEMKNISANPKMVVRLLSIVPIIFILIVYILNPDYFSPLFSSVLGYIIIIIIIVMFILYFLLLRRILRVE